MEKCSISISKSPSPIEESPRPASDSTMMNSNTGHDSPASRPPALEPSEKAPIEKSMVRKYDGRFIPTFMIAWLCFYIDRAALPLARVNHMEESLKLTGKEFNIAAMIFFVPFIFFNIPGNLILRRLGAGLWLPAIIIAWGVVTTCSGLVTTFGQLCATRVLLGLCECAFLGNVMLYLGFFYTEHELVSRVALFYSSSALAGAIAGSLAVGLAEIRYGGYEGWPWIFFVEGAVTTLVGIATYFILPNSPHSASFLTEEERVIAIRRMLALDRRHQDPESLPTVAHGGGMFGRFLRRGKRRSGSSSTDDHQNATTSSQPPPYFQDRLTRDSFRRAILNPLTPMMALACFLNIVPLYSFTIFLPTIIQAMGYTGQTLNVMTVFPNLAGFAFTLAAAWWADKTRRSAVPLVTGAAVGALGYILLLVGSFVGPPAGIHKELQYTGTFFVAMGVNAMPPIALSWISVNTAPHYVRAIVLGFVISVGNFGALVAAFTYIKTQAPGYTIGHTINLACLITTICVAGGMLLFFRRENAKRAAGERDYRLDPGRFHGLDRERYELELGWLHPKHRFQY